MLLWVISVLHLNSSEVYHLLVSPLIYVINPVDHQQSSLPSFPKTTHVRIASSIALDFSAKLTQDNSLPAALLTNCLLWVTAVVSTRNLCAALNDQNAFLGVILNSSHLQVSTLIFIITYPTVGQRKKVTAVTFFPARPRPDQRGTNTGQIRKVPVYEITWSFVYRMGETRSQLGANNEILVCLVREIWQFKLFAGKEVTAVPATRGEGGYWRRGRRLLCLCWDWITLSFSKHWK